MNDIFDVAIIGSGPAGLTAGIYTSRANLKTLILAGEKWGGQLMLTTTVENYPGFLDGIQGPDLMLVMKNQAEKLGCKIVLENAFSCHPELARPGRSRVSGSLANASSSNKLRDPDIRQDNIFNINDKYFAKSVIIATGADTQWLGLPNEQRLIGHGVSSCAPCDGFFFKGKKVAVIGGGDSAMEEALFLTKFASEVILIHRRDSFRASKIMQDRVKNNPKIKILFNTEVVDVLGNDHVEGLKLNNGEISIDGIFVAIGHKPNSEIFGDLVEIDERGYIVKSKTDGVFVAGDVHDHVYKQAITAAAFGTMAAMDCEKWLSEPKRTGS